MSVTLGEVWDGSDYSWGSLGLVRDPWGVLGRVGRPLGRSGMGQRTLGEVQDDSGDP